MSLNQQRIDPGNKKSFFLTYWTNSAHQGKSYKHQNQHSEAEKVEFFYRIMAQDLAELIVLPLLVAPWNSRYYFIFITGKLSASCGMKDPFCPLNALQKSLSKAAGFHWHHYDIYKVVNTFKVEHNHLQSWILSTLQFTLSRFSTLSLFSKLSALEEL